MRVVVTDAEFRDLSPERRILEAAGFDVEVASCRTPQQVIEAGRGADALVVQYAPVTAEVLDALDRVGIVSRYGVGVDSIDVAAATARGVWVANVPDSGTEEVAAHTVGLLLGLVRHVPFHDRVVRAGTWDFQATGPHHRTSTLTLGVVGLGRIGRTVAARAGCWFGRVVGYDPMLPATAWPADVVRVERDEVFATSDVVSLHLPLSSETHHLVDARCLELVGDGGLYLVNTARGELVDHDALFDALERGVVRGAALDVLSEEPPPATHPLVGHPRTVLTPHVAWYSEEAEAELRRRTAENVVAWARDGRPRTAVNDPGPR